MTRDQASDHIPRTINTTELSPRDRILRVHNSLFVGESLKNTIRQMTEIQHIFKDNIAKDISWLSEFMEILTEQRKELLKLANHPLFGVEGPEPGEDTEEASHDSGAETVILGSVGKGKSRSKS